MKPKFLNVLFFCVLGAIFVAMNVAVMLYVLRNRKPASTQIAKVATYDPTPGRYASRTRFEFFTVPERFEAGELAMWSLKIVDPKEKDRHGQPKYVRSFVQQGGQLLNLIVVSDDLSTFKRFAPDYKDYGHFLLQTSLPRAGTYRLYADYIPYKGRREVKQQTIEVGGATANASLQNTGAEASPIQSMSPTQRISVQANDAQGSGATYQVELQTAQLVSNRKAQLRFTVRDNAGRVLGSDFQPYFGALAQCVILSRDKQIYLHPELKSSAVKEQSTIFETQFPQAGDYKVWLQFQHHKAVVTAPFLITVVGEAGDATKTSARRTSAGRTSSAANATKKG